MRNRWLPVAAAAGVGLLGLWLRLPCAEWGWGGSVGTYSHLCYSDIGPLYWLRGFADGITPYIEQFEGRYLEYPVLIGLWMWLTATVVNSLNWGVVGFVTVTWTISLILITAASYALGRIDRQRVWWFALSPALLLTLGINWDALAVLASLLTLMWWRGRHPVRAGAALAIGVAAKLYPGLLLVPLLADAIRARRWRDLGITIATAAATWLAVNLPVYFANRDGWWEFYRFSKTRGIDFGSLWLALSYGLGVHTPIETANLLGLVAVGLTTAVLILYRRRIDIFTSAFVIVAVFGLFNKVYSPQYWLWLAPLAALAAPKLKHFVIWNLAEAGYFIGVWLFLLDSVDPQHPLALPTAGYVAAIVLHWLTTAWLVAITLRSSFNRQPLSGRLRR